MKRYLVSAILVVAACGGGGTNEDTPDAGDVHNGDCELGGRASADSYFPFEVGNLWRYEVTDPTGVDPPSTKRQEFTDELVPEGETVPVIVQTTIKSNGRTVNWLRREGTAIVRVRQEDYTPEDLLERVTEYQPYRLRIDEDPERLVQDATWDEAYTDIVYDPAGTELQRIDVIDQWTVLGVDVPCTTPFGQLSCVKLHQNRIQGGIAVKDFYFARGYGKVREEGGQTEEIIGCVLK